MPNAEWKKEDRVREEQEGVGGLGLGIGEAAPATNHQPLTTPLLPLDVPDRPGEEWREHTAERWRERDKTTFDQCVEMIRTGVTNQSELARTFKRSRNSIQALMMAEFTEDELVEIGKKSARIAEVTGISKTTELLDKAGAAKDVGGVAMATKLMHDIAHSLNDKPATITETRVRVTVEDFMEAVEQGPVIEMTNV